MQKKKPTGRGMSNHFDEVFLKKEITHIFSFPKFSPFSSLFLSHHENQMDGLNRIAIDITSPSHHHHLSVALFFQFLIQEKKRILILIGLFKYYSNQYQFIRLGYLNLSPPFPQTNVRSTLVVLFIFLNHLFTTQPLLSTSLFFWGGGTNNLK